MRLAIVGAQNTVQERVCTHWTGLQAAFTRLPYESRLFCCRSGDRFIQDIIDWKPDILVYNLIDMAMNEAWRQELRHKLPDTKIVFWYTDCRTSATGQITVDISKTVDLFLTSSEDPKGFHKASFGMSPQWLGQAAEPLPARQYSEKAAHDFIFIGGMFNRQGFEGRLNIVDELRKEHGLMQINGGSQIERAKVYQAMPKLYGSAKFTLDISHFWDIPKYTSNRYWVIPAFWGFGLTKRFPKHEELVPETHHVYWDTIDELLEKMDYYRKHEDERLTMIQKGWEYAKDHHTYEHRLRRLVELCATI